MGFVFTKLTRYILVAYLIYAGTNYLLRYKSYNISPKLFKSIAAKVADTKPNVRSAISGVTSGMRNSYNTLIPNTVEWHPFILGNLELNIFPMHLSLTEFAVIIGAPFETSGRAGFHWSNTTCTVLTGSVSRVRDSAVLEETSAFSTGANFRHGEFESYNYKFAQGTYVACYGRGLVPLSGVWTTTSSISHGEPFAAGRLILTFTQSIYDRVALSLLHTYNHYKSRVTGKNEL